jgi:hypothetical protein
VDITFNYFGVARQPDRHQIECIITILLRLCQKLTGLSLMPLRVKLAHHRSHMPSEFWPTHGITGAQKLVIAMTIVAIGAPSAMLVAVQFDDEAALRPKKVNFG